MLYLIKIYYKIENLLICLIFLIKSSNYCYFKKKDKNQEYFISSIFIEISKIIYFDIIFV